MKYRFVPILLLAISAAADDFRTFTDQAGRTVSAVIIKHDPAIEKVQLKRKGGKPIWVSPALFSSEDQQFIQNWIDESKFMASANFKISIEEHKTSWESCGDDSGNRRERKTHYTITLKNNNNEALENLRLEYCIFRDRDLNGEEFIESDVREEQIGIIPANSTKTVRSSTGLSFKANNFLNEVVGICVRIYAEPKAKPSSMREQRFPEDLKEAVYVWKKEEVEPSIQQQADSQNHAPVDLSSVNMTKDDIKTLIKTYSDAREDEDFESWEKNKNYNTLFYNDVIQNGLRL